MQQVNRNTAPPYNWGKLRRLCPTSGHALLRLPFSRCWFHLLYPKPAIHPRRCMVLSGCETETGEPIIISAKKTRDLRAAGHGQHV